MVNNVNQDEQKFFDAFFALLTPKQRQSVRLQKMSNGAYSVTWNRGEYVGKVRLTGRKHWIQIMKNIFDADVIEGEVDDLIQELPKWVRTMK